MTEDNNKLTFYGLKLKCAALINSTYTLNVTVHILRTAGERPIKVFHLSKLLELYPNFEFSNNDDYVLIYVLGDTSIQSSYWSIIILTWKILRLKDIVLVWPCCMYVCVCVFVCAHARARFYHYTSNVQMQRYTYWCINVGIT